VKTYTLVAVHDVRPLDWMTGKRESQPAEDLPECTRCGRHHAVVWTLSGSDGSTLTVGCRCGARMLEERRFESVLFGYAAKLQQEAMDMVMDQVGL
jgi:hypothetical protein